MIHLDYIAPLTIVTIFATLIAAAAITYYRRLHYINSYTWPPGLLKKLAAHHPNLSAEQIDSIAAGLRQYFRAYVKGGFKSISMPSQAVDDLWHEFILYTRDYQTFCNRAFGRFLHHTPAVALAPAQRASNEGLRRVWTHACREEKIDPRAATALPLLFALDSNLGVPGGYHYSTDCETLRRQGIMNTQCGGDFVSVSFDGTTVGLGDSGNGDGDGDGGDGGGCGGGGD